MANHSLLASNTCQYSPSRNHNILSLGRFMFILCCMITLLLSIMVPHTIYAASSAVSADDNTNILYVIPIRFIVHPDAGVSMDMLYTVIYSLNEKKQEAGIPLNTLVEIVSVEFSTTCNTTFIYEEGTEILSFQFCAPGEVTKPALPPLPPLEYSRRTCKLQVPVPVDFYPAVPAYPVPPRPGTPDGDAYSNIETFVHEFITLRYLFTEHPDIFPEHVDELLDVGCVIHESAMRRCMNGWLDPGEQCDNSWTLPREAFIIPYCDENCRIIPELQMYWGTSNSPLRPFWTPERHYPSEEEVECTVLGCDLQTVTPIIWKCTLSGNTVDFSYCTSSVGVTVQSNVPCHTFRSCPFESFNWLCNQSDGTLAECTEKDYENRPCTNGLSSDPIACGKGYHSVPLEDRTCVYSNDEGRHVPVDPGYCAHVEPPGKSCIHPTDEICSYWGCLHYDEDGPSDLPEITSIDDTYPCYDPKTQEPDMRFSTLWRGCEIPRVRAYHCIIRDQITGEYWLSKGDAEDTQCKYLPPPLSHVDGEECTYQWLCGGSQCKDQCDECSTKTMSQVQPPLCIGKSIESNKSSEAPSPSSCTGVKPDGVLDCTLDKYANQNCHYEYMCELGDKVYPCDTVESVIECTVVTSENNTPGGGGGNNNNGGSNNNNNDDEDGEPEEGEDNEDDDEEKEPSTSTGSCGKGVLADKYTVACYYQPFSNPQLPWQPADEQFCTHITKPIENTKCLAPCYVQWQCTMVPTSTFDDGMVPLGTVVNIDSCYNYVVHLNTLDYCGPVDWEISIDCVRVADNEIRPSADCGEDRPYTGPHKHFHRACQYSCTDNYEVVPTEDDSTNNNGGDDSFVVPSYKSCYSWDEYTCAKADDSPTEVCNSGSLDRSVDCTTLPSQAEDGVTRYPRHRDFCRSNVPPSLSSPCVNLGTFVMHHDNKNKLTDDDIANMDCDFNHSCRVSQQYKDHDLETISQLPLLQPRPENCELTCDELSAWQCGASSMISLCASALKTDPTASFEYPVNSPVHDYCLRLLSDEDKAALEEPNLQCPEQFFACSERRCMFINNEYDMPEDWNSDYCNDELCPELDNQCGTLHHTRTSSCFNIYDDTRPISQSWCRSTNPPSGQVACLSYRGCEKEIRCSMFSSDSRTFAWDPSIEGCKVTNDDCPDLDLCGQSTLSTLCFTNVATPDTIPPTSTNTDPQAPVWLQTNIKHCRGPNTSGEEPQEPVACNNWYGCSSWSCSPLYTTASQSNIPITTSMNTNNCERALTQEVCTEIATHCGQGVLSRSVACNRNGSLLWDIDECTRPELPRPVESVECVGTRNCEYTAMCNFPGGDLYPCSLGLNACPSLCPDVTLNNLDATLDLTSPDIPSKYYLPLDKHCMSPHTGEFVDPALCHTGITDMKQTHLQCDFDKNACCNANLHTIGANPTSKSLVYGETCSSEMRLNGFSATTFNWARGLDVSISWLFDGIQGLYISVYLVSNTLDIPFHLVTAPISNNSVTFTVPIDAPLVSSSQHHKFILFVDKALSIDISTLIPQTINIVSACSTNHNALSLCGLASKCTTTDEKDICECLDGWGGPLCSIQDCNRLNCLNGKCNSDGQCECRPGFTGERCQTHVLCEDSNNTPTYIASSDRDVPVWAQEYGRIESNNDITNPVLSTIPRNTYVTSSCSHHGYITPTIGQVPSTVVDDDYKLECSGCRCQNHWTGDTCQTCSLNCGSSSIPDAQCSSCMCAPGFTGTSCECYDQYFVSYYHDAAKFMYAKWQDETMDITVPLKSWTEALIREWAMDMSISTSFVSVADYGWTSDQARFAVRFNVHICESHLHTLYEEGEELHEYSQLNHHERLTLHIEEMKEKFNLYRSYILKSAPRTPMKPNDIIPWIGSDAMNPFSSIAVSLPQQSQFTMSLSSSSSSPSSSSHMPLLDDDDMVFSQIHMLRHKQAASAGGLSQALTGGFSDISPLQDERCSLSSKNCQSSSAPSLTFDAPDSGSKPLSPLIIFIIVLCIIVTLLIAIIAAVLYCSHNDLLCFKPKRTLNTQGLRRRKGTVSHMPIPLTDVTPCDLVVVHEDYDWTEAIQTRTRTKTGTLPGSVVGRGPLPTQPRTGAHTINRMPRKRAGSGTDLGGKPKKTRPPRKQRNGGNGGGTSETAPTQHNDITFFDLTELTDSDNDDFITAHDDYDDSENNILGNIDVEFVRSPNSKAPATTINLVGYKRITTIPLPSGWIVVAGPNARNIFVHERKRICSFVPPNRDGTIPDIDQSIFMDDLDQNKNVTKPLDSAFL